MKPKLLLLGVIVAIIVIIAPLLARTLTKPEEKSNSVNVIASNCPEQVKQSQRVSTIKPENKEDDAYIDLEALESDSVNISIDTPTESILEKPTPSFESNDKHHDENEAEIPMLDAVVQSKVLAATSTILASRSKDLELFRSVCAEEVTFMRYFAYGAGSRGKNTTITLKNDELLENLEIEVADEYPIDLSKLFPYWDANVPHRIINIDFNCERWTDGIGPASLFDAEIEPIIGKIAYSVTRRSAIIVGKEYFLLTDVYALATEASYIINGTCALFRGNDNKLLAIIDIRY